MARAYKQSHLNWRAISHPFSISRSKVIPALWQENLIEGKQIKGNIQTTDYSHYVFTYLQHSRSY